MKIDTNIIDILHNIGPPISSENPVISPKFRVNDPIQTLIGAKIPLRVAWAVIAKITKTIKALIFPDPVRTTNREIHPLVSTIPTPNIMPPIAIANIGMSELKNRCSANEKKS